jgi:hypothetical protein
MVSVSQSVSQLPRSYSYRIHTNKYKPRRHARRARRLQRAGCQAPAAGARAAATPNTPWNTRPARQCRQGLLLAWALAALGFSRLPATCL